MRRGPTLLLIIVASSGLIVAVVVSLLHNGLSARARPSAMEEMLARNAWHLSIPSDARAMRNPLPASPENLKEARLHFADHCADLSWQRWQRQRLFGRGLYPKPPDLRASRDAKPLGRRTFLDYREWSALHGDAGICQSRHERRFVEAGAVY